jgi:hypothetical protein
MCTSVHRVTCASTIFIGKATLTPCLPWRSMSEMAADSVQTEGEREGKLVTD